MLLFLSMGSPLVQAQEVQADQSSAGSKIQSMSEILTGFDAAAEKKKDQPATRSFRDAAADATVRNGLKTTLAEEELGSRGIQIRKRDNTASLATGVSVAVVADSAQNFSNILFQLGTARFADDTGTREQLHQIALAMKARPNLQFLLEGHTCDLGTEEYNFHLSETRADTVRRYLLREGVAMHQIFTLGFGESEPLVPNTSETRRQLNRRVVIYVRSDVTD